MEILVILMIFPGPDLFFFLLIFLLDFYSVLEVAWVPPSSLE